VPISNQRDEKIKSFCKCFGFSFKDFSLLNIAFSHSSLGGNNYERLEFLGDCVLRMVVSEYLFNKYKKSQEGVLTKMRAEIVSDKTLSLFAKKINLGDFVLLGKSEKKKGKGFDTILACVFEALLGVIFLEYGNKKAFEIVHKFIFENFKDEIEKIENEIDFLNPKAMLQEYTQGTFHTLPEYKLIETTGLEHDKILKVQVVFNNVEYPIGVGNSKKEAQKNAAKNVLLELNLIKKENKW